MTLKEKVTARLRNFTKANLSQKRIDTIVDKLVKKLSDDSDDVAIDAAITDFNEASFMSFEEIAKEDDRVRTLEADKKKAEELAAKAKPTNEPPTNEPPVPDDAPAWAKPFMEKLDKVTTELDNIKSGTIKQTKQQEAQALLEKSEVFKGLDDEGKKFMLKNVELDSETPFEEQITSLEGVFSKMIQSNADGSVYGGAAGTGNPSSSVNEKEIEAMVENM